MAIPTMTAVARCVEALYSRDRQPLSEALALQGWRLLRSGLPRAVAAPDFAACKAAEHGACWGFVAEKWRLILFGRYPYEQQWRPALATGAVLAMLLASALPAFWSRRGARVLMATRPVDFRKGADSLAALVQTELRLQPFSGVVFVFRAKRADRVKLLYWDGTGLCLLSKRLEDGRFRWPRLQDGMMRLSPGQLAALLEGLDWRRVHARRVAAPTVAA